METENGQADRIYDMIFMLGGLWAAFALLVGKEEKHMCDTLGRLGKDRAFFEKWSRYDFKSATCALGFSRRWEKKNKVLRKEGNIHKSQDHRLSRWLAQAL